MNVIKIIPARYESTRLPGKLLLRKNGKTLLQHVYENTRADYVATSDMLIRDEVINFGGKVIMTSNSPQNGTERVAEAVNKIDPTRELYNTVVNIQGDEPDITNKDVNNLITHYKLYQERITTLITESIDANFYGNDSQVKCVIDKENWAMYFSRKCIPGDYHIGIYCYHREILEDIVSSPATQLAQIENLEQVKFLELGYQIKTLLIDKQLISINTQEDYDEWLKQ